MYTRTWLAALFGCAADLDAAPPRAGSAARALAPDELPEVGWSVIGSQVAGNLGQELGSAGDVNGDGYVDVLVGAPGFDNPEPTEGQLYVYHGSALGLSTVPDWTGEGDQDYVNFGGRFAPAGDVDGDGYGDVIVAMPYYDTTLVAAGRAQLYLGSAAGLEPTPSWVRDGIGEVCLLGQALLGAGDVDQDGYDDVVLVEGGTLCAELPTTISLFRGSADGLEADPTWSVSPPTSGGAHGRSLAAADVNGDGAIDLVACVAYDGPSEYEERVLLYLGADGAFEDVPDWTGWFDSDDVRYGISVSAADVDADGYDDVIVGAPYYDSRGTAFLYHGSAAGLDSVPSWTVQGPSVGREFGSSVAGAGDVNADGYDDVVVGDPNDPGLIGSTGGLVSLFLGSATGLEAEPMWVLDSEQGHDEFGLRVVAAGDTNADGYADVLVSAPYWASALGPDVGAVWLFHGHCLDSADADADGVGDRCDCDNADPTRFPGGAELCDGVDNDCDEVVPSDELDLDGDGVAGCAGDCDDANAAVFPGAPEGCDGLDTSCAGLAADEQDLDGDGVMVCAGDCDDADPLTFPAASEQCDGRINACGGALPADETDHDADEWMACAGDCDDADPSVFPAAPELCDGLANACGALPADEVDADGDGYRPCELDCDDADAQTFPGAPETCDGRDNSCVGGLRLDELDQDEDGVMACAGDCADSDPAVFPGAPEACDGVDSSCAGAVPAGELDGDEDGYRGCAGDCDDDLAEIHPAAAEACADAIDNDCDGAVDEGCAEPPQPEPAGCGCAHDRGFAASTLGALFVCGGLWRGRRPRR